MAVGLWGGHGGLLRFVVQEPHAQRFAEALGTHGRTLGRNAGSIHEELTAICHRVLEDQLGKFSRSREKACGIKRLPNRLFFIMAFNADDVKLPSLIKRLTVVWLMG